MANTQYIYSLSRRQTLDIGVRWDIGHDEPLCRRPFKHRPDVLQLVETWISKHDVHDPRTSVWGYDDPPWEMWVGEDGGDPDLELITRPDWTISHIVYAEDGRAVGILTPDTETATASMRGEDANDVVVDGYHSAGAE